MVIGHIVNLTNKQEGENFKEWQQLIIEPPFMGRISATLVANKNKKIQMNQIFIYMKTLQKEEIKRNLMIKLLNLVLLVLFGEECQKMGKQIF